MEGREGDGTRRGEGPRARDESENEGDDGPLGERPRRHRGVEVEPADRKTRDREEGGRAGIKCSSVSMVSAYRCRHPKRSP